MWRKVRSNRLVFLTICVSIVVVVVAAGLLTWHALTQPPTPPQATCGAIYFQQGPTPQPITKNVPQVERCFYRAYQQCAATTMQVTETGVDTGTTTVYWPRQQANTCQVIAQTTFSGDLANAGSTRTETCQGVIPKNGGLLFQQCGSSGDVFVAG